MITLAVYTGIPAEQWAKEGARAIATAWDVLAERYGTKEETREDGSEDGIQYSG